MAPSLRKAGPGWSKSSSATTRSPNALRIVSRLRITSDFWAIVTLVYSLNDTGRKLA